MKKITLLFMALLSIMSISAATYLRGSFNDWGTTHSFSNGSVTVTLNANETYEFKVNDGSKWYGNNGNMKPDNCSGWTFSENTNNARITTTVAGDYVFTWSSNKVSVTYPHTVAGTTNLTGYEWKPEQNIMSKNGETHTLTFVDKAPETYEFKITRGNWEWSIGYGNFNSDNSDITATDNGGNIKFTLSNQADVKIILSADLKISVELYYDVEVIAGTGGTVSGGGENIRHNTNTAITATPNTGYHFVQWTDGDENASREITVTKNETYTATFAINTYEVTVETKEGGTVTGFGTYEHGKTATLIATANAGYEFEGWYNESNELISRDAIYEPTVTSNLNLTAKFQHANVTFTNQSTLEFATYGKLSYELAMPDDRWYWISLPFDVKVSDIVTTGENKNYKDLVFTEYDAETRAGGENGWINWKTAGYTIEEQTLTANKGYVIGPKTTAENGGDKFPGWTITFPSVSTTNTVEEEATNLTATNTGGTTINDNWNIIGTGLYHEGSLSNNINYVAIPDNDGDYNYYYISSLIEDLKQLTSFAPFEAFFVQHGGEYSATATVATTSAELAPVARAKAQEQEQIYLINMNEAHTVVILNAEGSEGYTAGEDFLEMNVGNRIEMIYSFDAEDALAFNHRATEAQSIALGGYVATAGEQTISLDAYNGNAEAVTLIDNVTGTTTDLLAEDYTFTAEVGSLDGRFTIVFAAQKAGSDTTVDCYNSIANQVIAYGTADHCTVSGLTAGEAIVVYNTMGQLVFATTADSETITLPSLTAGNYLILHNGTTNKVTLR